MKVEFDEGTFKALGIKDQIWVLYSTFNCYRDATDRRLHTLEQRKIKDTTYSGFMGLVGGTIASLLKRLF